jgi:hypothetical protein
MNYEFDFTNSKDVTDSLVGFEETSDNDMLSKKRLKIIRSFQLVHDKTRLYLLSRYRQIPFPYHQNLSILNLTGIFSFILFEGFESKIFGYIVYFKNQLRYYLISECFEASIQISDHLKDNPNHFISKYDYFVSISFSFFSFSLFLKESNSKSLKKVVSFLKADVNSYISLKNSIFRVINIVFKNIYQSAYRDFSSDFEDDGIVVGRKPKVPKLIKYKLKEYGFNKHRLYIVYDIETVPDLLEKKHYLYCLCATTFSYYAPLHRYTDDVDYSKEFFENRKFECNLIKEIDEMSADCLINIQHKVAEKFAEYIIKVSNEEYNSHLDCDGVPMIDLEVRVVGFNNRNFDDHHITQDLLRKIKYYRRLVHKRDMKIVSHEISSFNIVDGISITIFFDDVVIWLPEISTLKVACKEMDISLGKLDFNAVTFNQKCLDKKNIVKYCSIKEFPEFWGGDLSLIQSQIKRAERSKKFRGLNDAFLEFFKINLDINSFDQLIDMEPFVTNYCMYDVFATAELFLKLNVYFSECVREVFNENDLVDQVIHKKYEISDVYYDDDSMKRKNAKFDTFTFEFLQMSSYLTPSQVSYTIFKLMFKDNLRINNNYNPSIANVIEDAFFGGLVLFGGIGKFDQSLIAGRDIRSQLPCAACAPMPILNDEYDYCQNLSAPHINSLNSKINKAIKIRRKYFFEMSLHSQTSVSEIYECIDFIGVFRCLVTPPESAGLLTTISPLILATKSPSGARKINTFNIPYIKFFSTPHIKNFILYGWKVEILKCDDNIQYLYNLKTKMFESCYQNKFCYLKKFISFFNDKKANSPNKVMKKFFKALMNLLCGRLAMRADCLTTTLTETNTASGFDSSISRVKPFDYNKSDKWLALFINSYGHNIILSKIFMLELKQIYDRVAINLREPVIIYCDTDSIYYDTKHVLSDIDFEISLELGYFDVEIYDFRVTWSVKLSGDELMSIYVLFKKGYIIVDSRDYIKDFKTKGVPQKDIKSIFYNNDGKLNQEHLDLLFKSSISIPINKLFNRQERDTLKKTFFNLTIVKNLKIERLDKGLLDFSWRPSIQYTDLLKLTHSPCNHCSVCKEWYSSIIKHKNYNV